MSEHKGYYDKWYKIWSECSDEVLDATALIRVMECTNGCVQWAFRDKDEKALPIEQTRECMKVSMGAIKSKVLPLPYGGEVRMPVDAIPLMDTARDLYQKMKTDDPEAYDEFYALSKAHFKVLGKDRIDEKFQFFSKYFEEIFTKYWIEKGLDYIYYVGEFDGQGT